MMRIGLLGASRIAPVAVIAPASRRPDVTVTAVAARDGEHAARFAREHDVPAVAASYGELVVRDDVDLVYCALPAPLQLELCEQALAAGKMLLIEKPFAADAGAARRIAAAAEAAGRPALEAFHHRFHAQFRAALEIVNSARLGRVRRLYGVFDALVPQTEGELRWDPRLGGGAVMDLGCYVAHALRTLMGSEPEVLEAQAEWRGGVDAALRAELAFGDASATVACAMTRPFRSLLKVTGDEGVLTLHGFVAPQNGGRLILRSHSGTQEESATGPTTYEAQLDHVVRVWRGEAAPLTGGADAVANMTVIDACRSASRRRSSIRGRADADQG